MPRFSTATKSPRFRPRSHTAGAAGEEGVWRDHDHGYKRNGTATLFAALNGRTGEVFGQIMQRHRHQELIRFLNALERDVPAGRSSTSSSTTTRLTSTRKCVSGSITILAGHSHLIPTLSSWLNVDEGFYAILTRRRLQKGIFRSMPRRRHASAALPSCSASSKTLKR